jgi:hypothetical protein
MEVTIPSRSDGNEHVKGILKDLVLRKGGDVAGRRGCASMRCDDSSILYCEKEVV